ncbi:MAG: cysteine desulfurase/selenocysteine lyase [Gammaproteobacteria bacterium]
MGKLHDQQLDTSFDFERIRQDFPILKVSVNGRPLVYLDNAATTQKPQVVIDTVADYYRSQNANIHRGVHTLSQLATEAYETARGTVQNFITVRYSLLRHREY